MSTRDRMVLIAIVLVAILGGAWLKVVSPERSKASKLNAQVAAAKAALASAESNVSSAKAAEEKYAQAYASIVNLGKAVPPTQEVTSLIYEISQASNDKSVDFSSITNGSSGTTAGATGTAADASAAAAGFTQLPFTFVFEGGFFELEHLFRQLADLTSVAHSGEVEADGRLLTIQSVKLAPAAADKPTPGKPPVLAGTVTASAYVLPPSQGLTAGATSTSPTGAGASPASSSTTASSATAPAVVKVNP
jgi:hypothetical protein